MARTSSRGSWRWWIPVFVLATLTLFEPLSVHAARGAAKRYIVVLKDSAGDPRLVATRDSGRYGAQVTHIYRLAFKGYAATIPSDRVAALKADPEVRFLSPDAAVQATDQTLGTGVNRINAENKANKGMGVNVAVIDTGIDINHPDLAANIVGGTNCSTGGKKNYDDGNGHGTHVAGIIGAIDNGIGVVGVAPEAKLWAVRVLNDSGSGTTSNVICGFDFVDSLSPAKGGPITVANMSLGGFGSDDGNCGNTNGDPMHLAICRAVGWGRTRESCGSVCLHSRTDRRTKDSAGSYIGGKFHWRNGRRNASRFARASAMPRSWFVNWNDDIPKGGR